MKIKFYPFFFTATIALLFTTYQSKADDSQGASDPGLLILITLTIILLALLLIWIIQSHKRLGEGAAIGQEPEKEWLSDHLSHLESEQLEKLIRLGDVKQKNVKKEQGVPGDGFKSVSIILLFLLTSLNLHAQSAADQSSVVSSPGMIIMIALVFVPLVATVYFVAFKLNTISIKIKHKRAQIAAKRLVDNLRTEPSQDLYEKLVNRKNALDFRLNNLELSGRIQSDDKKGLLKNISEISSPRFIASKKKAAPKHNIDPGLIRLISWFLGSATLWLVIGTSVGEYIGIKFVSPDVDHVSWLSFGRLRPVHTNMVFWGWSSMAMVGLGYYVVSTVSNAPIKSIKSGYVTLILMNCAILAGTICLMAGVNNSGGEYREYTWPVMGLFAIGLAISLTNFLQTIAHRKTKEIYISNWYIIAAMMFLAVIVIVGYVPWWQNGLGETIIQGYYMHQAVGMWFMLFNLGLMYYFLPQQLNTAIYSYSLGILAFWSQILFYTLIGTHHFVFSSIPWWLQTVAIVGSVGMLIPVFSGTTNFLMTFRGNFGKISSSYTLPFYLVGIIFYFTGSTQGTAEAFRSTNLIWHFTDFTVAHSHVTMYGIIAFMLWGCIYTLVPRLTGKEPKQSLVGAHFWMALIGLLFYAVPLMIGGTLKGMGWVAGKPFIDGVITMAPYWLWRAIGGSLMWGSHLFFAWNMYTMVAGSAEMEISKEVISQIDHLEINTNYSITQHGHL